MKLFKCQSYQPDPLFREHRVREVGASTWLFPGIATLSAFEPAGDIWRALATSGGTFRFCANADHTACNWLVRLHPPRALCLLPAQQDDSRRHRHR